MLVWHTILVLHYRLTLSLKIAYIPSFCLFCCVQWALLALLDPIRCVEYLIYIGYAGDLSSAVRITRRRHLDRKKQQSDRNVYQCFVFGPKEAGKTALLNSFTGRCSLWICICGLDLLNFNLFKERSFTRLLFVKLYDIYMPLKCRPFPEEYVPTATDNNYAVHIVDQPGVSSIASSGHVGH